MVRRLMKMRVLDAGRLFGTWWRIAIDATLQQRSGRRGGRKWRMVLEARLIGPGGLDRPLRVEFLDVRNPARDKQDCERKGFDRLSRRLKAEFPRLPICLLLDGLYAVKAVFDRCKEFGWKYMVVFKEGRQPAAFDEAAQIMGMRMMFSSMLCLPPSDHPTPVGQLRFAPGQDIRAKGCPARTR